MPRVLSSILAAFFRIPISKETHLWRFLVECLLLRGKNVFVYSAFPGHQCRLEISLGFVENFRALRLIAGWGKAPLPHCQENIPFDSFIQNCLQHPLVNTFSLADALEVISSFAETHSVSTNLLSKRWCCPPLSDRNARGWSCQVVLDVLESLEFQWSYG